MKKEVQVLVRMSQTLRREIKREQRTTGKTLKAIIHQSVKEHLNRRKRESVAAPE